MLPCMVSTSGRGIFKLTSLSLQKSKFYKFAFKKQ